MQFLEKNISYALLTFLVIGLAIILIIMPPIEQNLEYHNFSDNITRFKVANFWNVVTNIPFMIVGVLGMYKLHAIVKDSFQYFIFFLGVFLISIGSSYYHLCPSNKTLIWDRLPMTIAFMALLSITISEFVSWKKGKDILIPALITGLLSVLYWVITEDLKAYILVQFLPIMAMPFILILFKSRYTLVFGYWVLLISYSIAKLFEYYDAEIYNFTGVIGGHPLKHITVSMGISILLYTYVKRKKKFD